MREQTRETPAGARICGHTCGTDQDDGECMACGQIDCPDGEPLHYHHDGCPCCSQRPDDVRTQSDLLEQTEKIRRRWVPSHGMSTDTPLGQAVKDIRALSARCTALEQERDHLKAEIEALKAGIG